MDIEIETMSINNKHDAVGPMAGMIYQVYYYMKRLLKLQQGESASLELHDDVAVAGEKGLMYCQLKHTGDIDKVMTPRDHDLWKTLAMWVEIVQKDRTLEEQKLWIDKSQFVLLTNKEIENNPLYKTLLGFNKDGGKWNEVEEYVKSQATKNKGKDNDVDKFASIVYDYPLRKELLSKVCIERETDEKVLDDISHILRYQKHVRENNVRFLRTLLLGHLEESFVNTIQKKKPSEYTDETFDQEFGTFIRTLKDRVYVRRNQFLTIPENLKVDEQTFIRQLVDIGDAKVSSEKRRIFVTKERLAFENDYHEALSEISEPDRLAFEKNVHNMWDTIYCSKYTNIENKTDIQKQQAAIDVLTEVRKIDLTIIDQEKLGESSNGCFYFFSDGEKPTIGWSHNWMDLYNGQDWMDIYG